MTEKKAHASRLLRTGLAGLMILTLGCDRPGTPVSPPPSSAHSEEMTSPPRLDSSPEPSTSLPQGATACGELSCLQFDTPEDAFRHVLTHKPLILAVGESHAQRGKEHVDSSTKRFTNAFLPFLQGKASDLIVELMAPNPSCKKVTKEVRKKHEVVTEQQAPTAQNEYVQMGERARALGMVPDLLRPSCEDLEAIQGAGDEAISLTLETIARLTIDQVKKLLRPGGRKPEEAGKMIVTYGGILHNDPKPTAARAAWSFGPALQEWVEDGYLALDLFVPEFIDNTEIWQNLPWYPHYDRERLGDKTTLFRLDDGSLVLIFPVTGPADP